MKRRHVFSGRVVDLGIEEARLPDGRRVELEVIRHPGAAAVVPIHRDGTVTLVHQYRHAGGGMFFEIPAGLIEAGEDPRLCAARELAEEVRLRAGRLDLLVPLHTTPGFTDEVIHIFLGRELEPTPGELDPDEFLRPTRLPLENAIAMIEKGEITDSKTICGLLLALRKLGSPQISQV